MSLPQAPKRLLRFFHWFCHPDFVEDIEGDLHEKYDRYFQKYGKRKSWWLLLRDVLSLFRISLMRPITYNFFQNTRIMFRHHFKISFRTLIRDKGYSFINIGGLALGLATVILIGLWIHDELSFYKYHDNYDRIARVMQHRKIGDGQQTWYATPIPLAEELRINYGEDFERVITTSFMRDLVFTKGNETYTAGGYYMEQEGPALFSFKMLEGNLDGLNSPISIFLSQSMAQTIFGQKDPVGEVLEVEDGYQVTVVGVYENFPSSTDFADADFMSAWEMNMAINPRIKAVDNLWYYTSFQTFAQLKPGVNFAKASKKIKYVVAEKDGEDITANEASSNVFLHPMSKWHLQSRFENGVNTGGTIDTVWLFGMIGLFVLLLACINFMNLSTARSEKRSKEVGVRKVIGSKRSQLINQFYSESLLIASLAFLLALAMVYLSLPWFNEVADKQILFPWRIPNFWLISISMVLVTSLLAGSYPAFYLSSFKPIKALKGNLQKGSKALIPRKILVTAQFAISTLLIIGTLTVYRQIQYAQNRPLGYEQNNLVVVFPQAGVIRENFDLIRHDLLQEEVIKEMALTAAPLTSIWAQYGNISWEGKDPEMQVNFPNTSISYEYGKTVGWQFLEGRDFSEQYAQDSAAFIINETAVQLMGLENPVGKTIQWGKKDFRIVGVIKDVIVESPYQTVRPHLFHINKPNAELLVAKLNPAISANQALERMEAIAQKHDPAALLSTRFVDETYARKFRAEARIGELSTVFAILAIIISCLGLLGLIAYVADRRKKEIGIRKVLGANTIQLWQMLSKDFMLLVFWGYLLALPIAWYFLDGWLNNYEYRSELSIGIFLIAGIGTAAIALATISFQTIKAALINPVKSIKSE